MNGHTFLRSYRMLIPLGMISFMVTAYFYTVPEDYLTEEYNFPNLEQLLSVT